MNLLFLVNEDIASNLALNHLLPKLQHHKCVVWLSSQVGKRSSSNERLAALRFFEQTLFNQIVFPLIETQSKSSSRLYSFKALEEQYLDDFSVNNDINTENTLAWIKAHKIDLIISVRYGKILKQPVIDLPTHGVINLHSGLLPDYRGVMASFWAMLNNEKNIGTTLHFINNSDIDSGPIISQSTTPVDKESSYLMNVCRLYESGCRQIIDAIEKIEKGQTLPTTQAKSEGHYYSFPKQSDIDVFENLGLSLFRYDDVVSLAKLYG